MRSQSQDILIGLNSGINYTSFYGNSLPDELRFKMSANLGFSAQLKIGDKFYLYSELNYQQKGAKNELSNLSTQIDDYPFIDQNSKLKFEYIQLPLLLKKSFGKSESFFFSIGPSFGYLITVKDVNMITDHNTGKLISEGINDYKELGSFDQFNKIDFGGLLAVGSQIIISQRVKIFLEGIVNASINPIHRNGEPSYKHFGFGMHTGFLVGL
ncbi:MAG: PorT family protein [Bacteroidales bacterium]|nr:PorT family protein [Bacteroidales bacterium]MCF8402988.1 PorT family protein [Bacteroidales bacterium]